MVSEASVPCTKRAEALARQRLVHAVSMMREVSLGLMIQQLILGQGTWKRRSSNCRVRGIAVRGLQALMYRQICSPRSVLGVEELLPLPAQASQAGYTNPPVYTGRARCGQRPTSHQHGSQSGCSQSHAARRSRSLASAWQDVNVLAQNSFFWRGSHDRRRSTKTSDMLKNTAAALVA